jgi:hypothetical protein
VLVVPRVAAVVAVVGMPAMLAVPAVVGAPAVVGVPARLSRLDVMDVTDPGGNVSLRVSVVLVAVPVIQRHQRSLSTEPACPNWTDRGTKAYSDPPRGEAPA